jgi:hypothetical protein
VGRWFGLWLREEQRRAGEEGAPTLG